VISSYICCYELHGNRNFGEIVLKLKHLLLGIVILTVAVYGGAKTYIYFKAKEELEKLVQMASPFVEISYGDISSDLRGSLKVTDLDLISLAGGESMQIGAMEIKGSGPGFLLELTEGFKKSGPPADMVLHIGRASVPVDQGFGANFDITGMGGGNSNPSQEAKCLTVGHRLISRPISAMIFCASNASMPSMAVRSTPTIR